MLSNENTIKEAKIVDFTLPTVQMKYPLLDFLGFSIGGLLSRCVLSLVVPSYFWPFVCILNGIMEGRYLVCHHIQHSFRNLLVAMLSFMNVANTFFDIFFPVFISFCPLSVSYLHFAVLHFFTIILLTEIRHFDWQSSCYLLASKSNFECPNEDHLQLFFFHQK